MTEIVAAAEYVCREKVNVYDGPHSLSVATQASAGRHLQVLAVQTEAIAIRLCEDEYPGWVKRQDLSLLEPAQVCYQPVSRSPAEIQQRLPQAIQYAKQAMQVPNQYVWGGTVPPNYDCSGLMQAAFAAAGIWIPRDAYQQEAFCETIGWENARPGDLVFFSDGDRIDHVGLYLGEGSYIHSSSPKHGNDGIAINRLQETANVVERYYYQRWHSMGRVAHSYQPLNCEKKSIKQPPP
ncbi:C40 family peptidase [Geitlerinema sp. PCC 9228]|jgi:cell wall-associated NlpC family hydrolase|uniref:C40 family peptidase n=1 Tax=Geitlerinema sp. PCC 9228 TaxID=111611 RepID=UPI0008F9C7EF|nr:C40 family peptidase [Geitlerinema sp. PCC 9228]